MLKVFSDLNIKEELVSFLDRPSEPVAPSAPSLSVSYSSASWCHKIHEALFSSIENFKNRSSETSFHSAKVRPLCRDMAVDRAF
jgi:hypothetical protein